MTVVVQKYGGSSVGSTERIKNIAKNIVKRKNKDTDLVIVVSAMGKTTDDLIALSKGITQEPDKRELDAILSTGEMISSALLAMAIKDLGYDAISYTAHQIGIQTSGQYGKALIKDINDKKLKKSFKEGKIVIVAGFQGINGEGDITTLGRGGSDTTAVAMAVKLQGSCEIYTDVDGIYSVDPRVYSEAKKLDEIEYEEMLELASLGAQIMHSRSIELAQKYGIPIYVGLSNSDIKGTVIREVKNMDMESKPVTGIATSDEDVAVTLQRIPIDVNILATIFEAIGSMRINIDMISQTSPIDGTVNVSFTIPKESLKDSLEIIDSTIEHNKVIVDEDITKFSMVGLGMKTTSGVAARMFRVFSENNIEIKMITTSEIRITCAIKTDDKLKAIQVIAKEFNM
ncbi:aspartate kinase [Clostridium bowmanii]|uniref:aspartate kinase n=1 Tax=Clostridium bowmanii TaxID=132925 RepID=UPI001C0B4B4B|nr:aspartate kinase [Clostridium bowmanii]MBU3189329.1 aspartate kinase [Clostridium bowmanii]MCA1073946.1 aspartate kinase [Clostridium bowmanii]